MNKLTGSAHIDCGQKCEVPEGVVVVEVPRLRHAWSDVASCPNDNCGRWFMVVQTKEKPSD
jgi:hypothetical protein